MSDLSGHGDGESPKVENPLSIAQAELQGKYGVNAAAYAQLVISTLLGARLVSMNRPKDEAIVSYTTYMGIMTQAVEEAGALLGVTSKDAIDAVNEYVALVIKYSDDISRRGGVDIEVAASDGNPINPYKYSTPLQFNDELQKAVKENRVPLGAFEGYKAQ